MFLKSKVMFAQVLLTIFLVSTLASASEPLIPELQVVDNTHRRFSTRTVLTISAITLGAVANSLVDIRRIIVQSFLKRNARKLDCSNTTTLENDDLCEDFKEDVARSWGDPGVEFSFALLTDILGIMTAVSIPLTTIWDEK